MRAESLDEARERLRPYVEKAKTFSGWDFSQVRAKRLAPDLPWDYVEHARELSREAVSILDIGTGGGERFTEICLGFEGAAIATEAWPPNVPVAAERFRRAGIRLIHCGDEMLPLGDASLNLIVNRHSGLDPAEVARILTSGGIFFTQQVDRSNGKELQDFFPERHTDWGDTFERYRDGFHMAGMEITSRPSARNKCGLSRAR